MATKRQPSSRPTNSWEMSRNQPDEIVEEIHRLRKAYAARFDNDLGRIFEDLKSKEAKNPTRRTKATPAKATRQP